MKLQIRKRIKSSSIILLGVYFAMLVLCVYLNFQQNIDKMSLSINVVMFLIVGIIFYLANNCLKKVGNLTEDFHRVSQKFTDDYKQEGKYLEEKYSVEEQDSLFTHENLRNTYKKYLEERKRLGENSATSYKCKIDDYFNQELIDGLARKNLLNLIPGTMTGLGILGTFIGLSFGLQEFNTGSADQIAQSIAPLMDGIKIAFHTSVYGMVFSLFFNFIYKDVLENAYIGLDTFLDTFEKYVSPDPENDSINKVLDMQQKQSEAITMPILAAVQNMNENIRQMLLIQKEQVDEMIKMPSVLADKTEEIIAPKFEKLTHNLDVFEKTVSANQVSAVAKLVDNFINKMNESMGTNFDNLRIAISQTCDLQKQNSDYMQNVLKEVGTMTLDIKQINEYSEKTISSMSEYINKIESLQGILNENFNKANVQIDLLGQREDKTQGYIDQLVEYERQITDTMQVFERDMLEKIEILGKIEKEMTESAREELQKLSEVAQKSGEVLEKAAEKQVETVAETAGEYKEKSLEILSKFEEDAGKHLENISEKVKTTMETLENVESQMTKTAEGEMQKLSEVAQKSGEVLEKAAEKQVETVAETAGEYKEKSLEILSKLEEDAGKHLENISEKVKTTMETLENVESQMTKTAEGEMQKLSKVAQKSGEALEKAAERQMETVAETAGEYKEKSLEILSKLEENAGKHLGNISEKVKTTMETLENVESQMTKTAEGEMQKLSEVAQKSGEVLEKAAERQIETVAETAGEYKEKSLEILSKLEEDAGKHLENISEKVKTILDAFESQINNIDKMSDAISTDMTDAAEKLSNASHHLNKDLEGSLRGTFEIFDQELAQITKHLSGTLAEVKDTTDRVPKVIEAAYEELEKSFVDMQKHMETMIHALDIMERNFPNTVE